MGSVQPSTGESASYDTDLRLTNATYKLKSSGATEYSGSRGYDGVGYGMAAAQDAWDTLSNSTIDQIAELEYSLGGPPGGKYFMR